MFCGSNVDTALSGAPSRSEMAKRMGDSEAICHKNVVDLKIPRPLTVWRRLLCG